MTSGYPSHLWSEKIWDSAVRWYPTCASGFTAAVVCAAAPGFETGGLWATAKQTGIILINWSIAENYEQGLLACLDCWVFSTDAQISAGNMWNTLFIFSSYLCRTWLKNHRCDHCLQRNRPKINWFNDWSHRTRLECTVSAARTYTTKAQQMLVCPRYFLLAVCLMPHQRL